ncbi:amidohydrolase, partial [Christensenellaceae bacterium OttesenSCG-928-L17]|nr:amidohydrolase [Christensenellaceae bacterium OttesenSCG-928-L17]
MLLLKNGYIIGMERAPFYGDILVKDGRIAAVGEHLNYPDAQIIDCTEQFVLPGFIDAHCHIGMWEDGIGDEGADGNESTDPITPEMRAVDGVNPFDPCFIEAREAGITTVATGPGSANVIGGQFAALKTAGRSVAEMTVLAPLAMKAALGENPKAVYAEQKATPNTRMAIAALFRKALIDAQEYGKKLTQGKEDEEKLPERDLGLEALWEVVQGNMPIKIHAHRADDILTAFRIAEEFHLKLSIEHCTEGHLIAEQLREMVEQTGAGIILGPLLSERPKVEMKNLSLCAPKILHEAGVQFALMTDHPAVPIQYLPLCAALCVREGLPEQAALEAITINAARVLGLENRLG